MIEVKRTSVAGVDAVWKVLADAWEYPSWVVGAARMRAVTPDWPAVGAELHHSIGCWPLLLHDSTRVIGCSPKRELRLRGRGWPMGEAVIELLLAPADEGGCEITMREDISAGPARILPRPIRVALIRPRNLETLRRLAYLAERRTPAAPSR